MDIFGPIAAVLATVSFVPQVIQLIKTKDTSSISLGMYILFVLGVLCWVIHGAIIKDVSVVVANSITFMLAFIILCYKIKYK